MALPVPAKPWAKVLVVIVLFAGVFFVAALLEAFISGFRASWEALIKTGVLFSSLGALYGTAAALDSNSGFAIYNRPLLRIVICSVFGAIAVGIVWSWYPKNFAPIWILCGAGVGAVLGWFGWSWAKYVDF